MIDGVDCAEVVGAVAGAGGPLAQQPDIRGDSDSGEHDAGLNDPDDEDSAALQVRGLRALDVAERALDVGPAAVGLDPGVRSPGQGLADLGRRSSRMFLDAGAVNSTVVDVDVDPAAATAPIPVAPGSVAGVTGADGAEAAEVPPVVAAATVTVALASPAATAEMVGTSGLTTASTTPDTVEDGVGV